MTLDDIRQTTDFPAIIVDHEGLIVFVNEPFTSDFGWEMSDVSGEPLSAIIPSDLRDAHNLGFSRYIATEQPTLLNKPLNLKIMTKDGRVLDAEHFIVAEKSDGRWSFGATIRLSSDEAH